MGTGMYFMFPNGKQKMQKMQVTNENSSLDEILSYGKNDELGPELVAQRVRNLYFERFEGMAFPVIQLANDLDIKVIVADFLNIAYECGNKTDSLKGYLCLYPAEANESPRIVVSNAESYGHQRWTVAHEIWHYLKHTTDERKEAEYYPEDSSNYDSTDNEEANANKFATELLMPENTFRFAYKMTSRWRRNQKLSQMFLVSEQAVKRRIRELKIKSRM